MTGLRYVACRAAAVERQAAKTKAVRNPTARPFDLPKCTVSNFKSSSHLRPLDVDGDDDDGGLDDERPSVGDAVHHEARRDDLHDEGADERADDRRAPARQGRPADDRGGDGVKLDVQ